MFVADKAVESRTRFDCAWAAVELDLIVSMSEESFPDGGFLEFIIKTIGNLAVRGARVFYDFQRF